MRFRRRPATRVATSPEEPTSGLRNASEEVLDWPPDPDAVRLMTAFDQLPRDVRDEVNDAICQWSTPDLQQLVYRHGSNAAVQAIRQSDLGWLRQEYSPRFWPEDVR